MFKLSRSNKLNFLEILEKSRHIYDEVPYIKSHRKTARLMKFLRSLTFISLAVVLVLVIISAVVLKDMKIFYDSAMSGKRNVERAIELISNQKFKEGREMSALAQADFKEASRIAERYKNRLLIRHITYFRHQFEDLEHLMLSAEVLSNALMQGTDFARNFETILARKNRNFNQLSPEDKKKMLELIYKSGPELAGIKANIDLALMNLDNIGYSGVLLPLKTKLTDIELKLAKVQTSLDAAIPMSSFLPAVLGYPSKASFLILLQNSDELRPTGGFIGTYGILDTEYGDIQRLETHDVYHLDMPVKDAFKKEPPAPLKKYLGVENWYFRDSNWSPDWPTAAKQAESFFYEEDKLLPEKDQVNKLSKQFDGLIAITPELITELLTIVGPVTVEGQVFDQSNFVELLQYKVEQEYIVLGKSSWHRKAVIGEIVKELKIKLFDLDPASMYRVLDVFNSALAQKDLMFYFKDQAYQELAADKGWTGRLIPTDGDYLMVVDANMASYKTDAVIGRKLGYKLSEKGAGMLYAELRLDYAHRGGFDWKTTRYQSYTRVYVPRGSQLISITGSEGDRAETYDELGKTVIAFFLKVEPGQIGNVAIQYRLPQAVEQDVARNGYSLYMQKQPGKDISQMEVELDFARDIKSYSPTGFFAEDRGAGRIGWDTELKTDRYFKVGL